MHTQKGDWYCSNFLKHIFQSERKLNLVSVMLGRSYMSMSFETLNLHEPAVFLAEMFLSGCMNMILFHITALYSNQKTGHKENHAMFSYSFCFLVISVAQGRMQKSIMKLKCQIYRMPTLAKKKIKYCICWKNI